MKYFLFLFLALHAARGFGLQDPAPSVTVDIDPQIVDLSPAPVPAPPATRWRATLGALQDFSRWAGEKKETAARYLGRRFEERPESLVTSAGGLASALLITAVVTRVHWRLSMARQRGKIALSLKPQSLAAARAGCLALFPGLLEGAEGLRVTGPAHARWPDPDARNVRYEWTVEAEVSPDAPPRLDWIYISRFTDRGSSVLEERFRVTPVGDFEIWVPETPRWEKHHRLAKPAQMRKVHEAFLKLIDDSVASRARTFRAPGAPPEDGPAVGMGLAEMDKLLADLVAERETP